jgi:ribosomal protein L15E
LKNSPYLFIHNQKKDIIKTKNIIKKKLGINIIHWRNHGYRSDKFTNEILESLNFRYVSNEVNEKKYFEEFILNDLKSRPINTLPDHENLPHSKEHEGGLSPEKWVILNSKKVKEMKKKNGIASLLLHPLCMYLEDDFQYMKKLLSILV